MKAGAALGILGLTLFGCATDPAQREIGSPAQRYAGNALVVLPRSCFSERSVPARHFLGRPLAARPTSSEPAVKTARLQAMLDGLVADAGATPTPGGGARPEAACELPPEASAHEPAEHLLADLRATDATIKTMQERGANYVVVLELHTVIACARRDDAVALALHGQVGPRANIGAPTPSQWSADDVCLEDEVRLSAWMFDATGAAVWALSRDILPTDEPGSVLDHVLERIPVATPLRRHRGEFEIAGSARSNAM